MLLALFFRNLSTTDTRVLHKQVVPGPQCTAAPLLDIPKSPGAVSRKGGREEWSIGGKDGAQGHLAGLDLLGILALQALGCLQLLVQGMIAILRRVTHA